jgi:hypothetical protein
VSQGIVNAVTSAIAPEARTIHLREDDVRETGCARRERSVPDRCDFVVLDDRGVAVDGVFDFAAIRLVVASGFLACHVCGVGAGSAGGNGASGSGGEESDSTCGEKSGSTGDEKSGWTSDEKSDSTNGGNSC